MIRSPQSTLPRTRTLGVTTLLVTLLPWSLLQAADDLVSVEQLRKAAKAGLAIVEKAARNYPKHRQCFSCHHQTLPMQAMVVARERDLNTDDELLIAQAKFTRASFKKRVTSMRRGDGFDPITVGYGLWALYLAGQAPDETTDAMMSLLLKTQREEGSWGRGSLRPPIQQSELTSALLAVTYMPQFATEEQRGAVTTTTDRAKSWVRNAPLQTQEDRNSQLEALDFLNAEPKIIAQAKEAVLEIQSEDGGWAQEEGMASDAYATGQTLYTLERIGLPTNHSAYQNGLRFLLSTQHPDGSWRVETRSEPLQIYFDNGDPHGKHQFISIAATSWGTIALSLALPPAE